MQPRKILLNNIVLLGNRGEWEKTEHHKVKDNNNPMPRLISHLTSCALYTLNSHIEAEAKLVDAEKAELITRLTMSEFSCYTKEKALSLEEYKQLIAAVSEMVKYFPPNIHFIFGTFAVQWSDGLIHNTGLHVQTPIAQGAPPLIHHFEKRVASTADLDYFNDSGERIFLYDSYFNQHSPEKELKDTAVLIHDANQFHNCIKITTRDGQEFMVAIDVCFDHLFQIALNNTCGLQDQLASHGLTVPKRGSHVIASDTIIMYESHLISRNPTHADPKATLDNIEEVTFSTPLFGKSAKLITCQLQTVKPLDKDNLNIYKTQVWAIGEDIIQHVNTSPREEPEQTQAQELMPWITQESYDNYQTSSSLMDENSIQHENETQEQAFVSLFTPEIYYNCQTVAPLTNEDSIQDENETNDQAFMSLITPKVYYNCQTAAPHTNEDSIQHENEAHEQALMSWFTPEAYSNHQTAASLTQTTHLGLFSPTAQERRGKKRKSTPEDFPDRHSLALQSEESTDFKENRL